MNNTRPKFTHEAFFKNAVKNNYILIKWTPLKKHKVRVFVAFRPRGSNEPIKVGVCSLHPIDVLKKLGFEDLDYVFTKSQIDNLYKQLTVQALDRVRRQERYLMIRKALCSAVPYNESKLFQHEMKRFVKNQCVPYFKDNYKPRLKVTKTNVSRKKSSKQSV